MAAGAAAKAMAAAQQAGIAGIALVIGGKPAR
jgi:hypothetical protein